MLGIVLNAEDIKVVKKWFYFKRVNFLKEEIYMYVCNYDKIL